MRRICPSQPRPTKPRPEPLTEYYQISPMFKRGPCQANVVTNEMRRPPRSDWPAAERGTSEGPSLAPRAYPYTFFWRPLPILVKSAPV